MVEEKKCLKCGKTFTVKFSQPQATHLLDLECWVKMDKWYQSLGSRPVVQSHAGLKYLVYHPDHVLAWINYETTMEGRDVRE